MEPEGLLPHSQVPTTCPCPEPARSSPYPPTSHFLKIHLNIILPSPPGSAKWSLSSRFLHQHPVHTSPLPNTRYLPSPSHFSRFYHPNILGEDIDYKAPHYVIFFTPLRHNTLKISWKPPDVWLPILMLWKHSCQSTFSSSPYSYYPPVYCRHSPFHPYPFARVLLTNHTITFASEKRSELTDFWLH
jgi:hypothetical protein